MKKYQVIFQPSGRRGLVIGAKTIIEASRELRVEIEPIFRGERICEKCKVKLEKGFFERFGIESNPAHFPPFTRGEKFIDEVETAEEYPLACAVQII